MKNTIIDVENLSKHYRLGELHRRHGSIRDSIAGLFSAGNKGGEHQSIWALKDVSFTVQRGNILGIVGRNGSGKSTLLKILSGITKPTTGKATIYGRVRTLLEVGTGFHPELTGRENIYLNGSVLGMTKAEITGKFDEIVDFSGVETFIDTPIKRYSSGMNLRLAFAVAAFLDAEILFADEVLAVGDIEFQRKCLGKMNDVVRDGRTIIFVSHQMSAVRSLCNQVMWLDKGGIIETGVCNEVVNHYEECQLKKISNHQHNILREGKNDNSFHIKKITLLDAHGEHTNTFQYQDDLAIILEVAGLAPAIHYSIEFSISGDIDAAMRGYMTFSVGSSGRFHNQYFTKDINQIRIDIGPLMLSNGDYYMSFSLTSAGQSVDTWEKACMFRIVECHSIDNGNAVYSAGCVLQHHFSPIQV